ncbi:hypothetical protein [Fusibacter ferrireducens]|uniref:Uncharacterized protein n=1 Tax=Fusibacter ferrireducens TaxID=2785058 RepID=A0ABR9ZTY1_9FIRM|nr:hypothetical protein [Fusibacter ferrireducens]MBF4693902.1 hypothetical protein [Fusibacter ferrireducens]
MYYMWSKHGIFPSEVYERLEENPGELDVMIAFYQYRMKEEEKCAKNNIPGFVSI